MGTADNNTSLAPSPDVRCLEDLPSGVMHLENLKTIRVEGEEAEHFLHNQFSSDVSALAAGQQQPGAYCNPKGRALAIYRLLRDDTGFNLVLPDDLAEIVSKRLTLYRMRSRVEIGIGERTGVFGYIGELPQSTNMWRLDNRRAMRIVADSPVPDEALEHQTPVLPGEFWKLAAILAGEPQVYAATSESFIPQQVNLDLVGGVSFSKGCYPGQEIVARVRYLGKIKQRMTGAVIHGAGADAVPGDPLFVRERPGQKAGMVVDAVRFRDSTWLSAMVPVEILDGGEIHLGTADGPQLSLLPPPYSIDTERSRPA